MGGEFCNGHTCPVLGCNASKSSGANGCNAHPSGVAAPAGAYSRKVVTLRSSKKVAAAAGSDDRCPRCSSKKAWCVCAEKAATLKSSTRRPLSNSKSSSRKGGTKAAAPPAPDPAYEDLAEASAAPAYAEAAVSSVSYAMFAADGSAAYDTATFPADQEAYAFVGPGGVGDAVYDSATLPGQGEAGYSDMYADLPVLHQRSRANTAGWDHDGDGGINDEYLQVGGADASVFSNA